MAFSQPEIYYGMLIAPTLRRFEAEPEAYELAFATCVAIDNILEVLALQWQTDKKSARRRIEEAAPAFKRVSAISVAFKHVEVEGGQHAAFIGMRAEHAVLGSGAAFTDGSEVGEDVAGAEPQRTVIMPLPGGSKSDVLADCREAADQLQPILR